ncbi:DUF2254 family protein [Parafrankia elaeagni]|uniref:DUF2254 family protein n=1 Tax=Parafrankia elaeagni TaxID=222534 RepID=UPI00036BCB33|nr:DUF2254 family protein [Parafrankia elaeagni]
MQALDQIEDCLTRLADRALGTCALLDRGGEARVVYPVPRWPDLVSLGLDETIQYGAASLQVVRRVRLLLDRVEHAAPTDRQPPLAERRALLDRLIRSGFPDPVLAATAVGAAISPLPIVASTGSGKPRQVAGRA